MSNRRMNRNLTKRLDALIALPLARFRTAIGRLTLDELAELEARIELMTVKQRLALGSHGIERHRAPNELKLLARRMAETQRESEDRAQAPTVQPRLVEFAPVRQVVPTPERLDEAA